MSSILFSPLLLLLGTRSTFERWTDKRHSQDAPISPPLGPNESILVQTPIQGRRSLRISRKGVHRPRFHHALRLHIDKDDFSRGLRRGDQPQRTSPGIHRPILHRRRSPSQPGRSAYGRHDLQYRRPSRWKMDNTLDKDRVPPRSHASLVAREWKDSR